MYRPFRTAGGGAGASLRSLITTPYRTPARSVFLRSTGLRLEPTGETKRTLNRTINPAMGLGLAGIDTQSSNFYSNDKPDGQKNYLSPLQGEYSQSKPTLPDPVFTAEHSFLRNLIPLRVKGTGLVSTLFRHAFLNQEHLIARVLSSLEHAPLPAVPRMVLAEAFQQMLEGTLPQRDVRALFQEAEMEAHKMLQSIDYSPDNPTSYQQNLYQQDKHMERVHSDPYCRLLAYELYAAACYYAQMMAVSSTPEKSAGVLLRTMIASDVRTDTLLQLYMLEYDKLRRNPHTGESMTPEEIQQEKEESASLRGKLTSLKNKILDPQGEKEEKNDPTRYFVDPDDLDPRRKPSAEAKSTEPSAVRLFHPINIVPPQVQAFVREMLLLERDCFGEFRFDARGDNRNLVHFIKLADIVKSAETFLIARDPLVQHYGNFHIAHEKAYNGRWVKYQIQCGKEDHRIDERLPNLETVLVTRKKNENGDGGSVEVRESTTEFDSSLLFDLMSGDEGFSGAPSADTHASDHASKTKTETVSPPKEQQQQPVGAPVPRKPSSSRLLKPPRNAMGSRIKYSEDIDEGLRFFVWYNLPICDRHQPTTREDKGALGHVEEFELAVLDKHRPFLQKFFLDR